MNWECKHANGRKNLTLSHTLLLIETSQLKPSNIYNIVNWLNIYVQPFNKTICQDKSILMFVT